MKRIVDRFYSDVVLAYPKAVLAVVAVLVGLLGLFSFRMEIDASSETLSRGGSDEGSPDHRELLH